MQTNYLAIKAKDRATAKFLVSRLTHKTGHKRLKVCDHSVTGRERLPSLAIIVINCGSKNSSKSLFPRFASFEIFYGDASAIRAGFC